MRARHAHIRVPLHSYGWFEYMSAMYVNVHLYTHFRYSSSILYLVYPSIAHIKDSLRTYIYVHIYRCIYICRKRDAWKQRKIHIYTHMTYVWSIIHTFYPIDSCVSICVCIHRRRKQTQCKQRACRHRAIYVYARRHKCVLIYYDRYWSSLIECLLIYCHTFILSIHSCVWVCVCVYTHTGRGGSSNAGEAHGSREDATHLKMIGAWMYAHESMIH